MTVADRRFRAACAGLRVATWVTYEVAFGLWGVLGGEIIGLGLIGTAFVMILRQRRAVALAEVAG